MRGLTSVIAPKRKWQHAVLTRQETCSIYILFKKQKRENREWEREKKRLVKGIDIHRFTMSTTNTWCLGPSSAFKAC